jgi:hypothetical protein
LTEFGLARSECVCVCVETYSLSERSRQFELLQTFASFPDDPCSSPSQDPLPRIFEPSAARYRVSRVRCSCATSRRESHAYRFQCQGTNAGLAQHMRADRECHFDIIAESRNFPRSCGQSCHMTEPVADSCCEFGDWPITAGTSHFETETVGVVRLTCGDDIEALESEASIVLRQSD